jgi:CheY-like chemotaxis protein
MKSINNDNPVAKILFVEDDKFWARAYIRELQDSGFDVIYARSARDAVDLLNNSLDFDAVILDIMMPTPEEVADTVTEEGMSTGLWVLEQIKHLIAPNMLCVWILTNRDLAAVTEKINEIGNLQKDLVDLYRKRDVLSNFLPTYLLAKIKRNRLQ